MRQDVIQLRKFYEQPVGRVAADMIGRRLVGLWPTLEGLHVAGIGYATPFLERLEDGAASCVALMPGPQGVVHWPDAARNATALVEEQELPLPDGSFDRVILAHAVEVADHLVDLLKEVRRILSPQGRVIVIAPRRRGTWSGIERTPFAWGQPFSRFQLTRLLGDNLLPVSRVEGALFLPPWRPFMTPKPFGAAERIGALLAPGLAGILIVECEKQVYGAVPARRRRTAYPIRPVPAGPHVAPPVVPSAPSSLVTGRGGPRSHR